jgi:hypothetical protein
MQNVESIERDLDLPPGDWQLISYGRLEEQPTIKAALWITAIFRKVRIEEDLIVERFSNVVERYLPTAEMIIFEVGCIFCTDTSKVLRAQYLSTEMVQTEIEIEFTKENCELIRRYWCDEEGRRFFNNPVSELTDNSNSYLLSAVCTNGQKILIPCTTVLQAFWARSSNLLSMLLDTRFLEFDYYVINTELSKLDIETGKAYLLLRQWSLDEDAKFLASILFSEKPEEAILRGQEISKRLCSMPPHFENIDDRYIAAIPPHSSKVALEVWGLSVKSSKFGDYMFIQRVIKSSFEPTFKSLTFDRDNDGRKSSQNGNDLKGEAGKDKGKKPIDRPRNWSPPRFEGKSKFAFTSELPGHDSTIESTKLGSFDQMFPNISNLKSEKLEQLNTEYSNIAEGQKESVATRWAKLLSVLPSTAISSSNAIKTTLSSAAFVREYTLDTNTSDIKIYLSNLIDAYKYFDRNKGNDEENIQIIKPRFPWPKSPAAGGALVFSLPGSIKEQNIAWLYSDPERKTRKRAICLEVTFLSDSFEINGVGYIIDIEVRFSKPRISKELDKNGDPIITQSIGSTSIVFVWKDVQTITTDGDSGKIGDFEFREILKAIASRGGYKGAREHFPEGCLTQSRNHSANGITFAKLLEELKVCVIGSPVD